MKGFKELQQETQEDPKEHVGQNQNHVHKHEGHLPQQV